MIPTLSVLVCVLTFTSQVVAYPRPPYPYFGYGYGRPQNYGGRPVPVSNPTIPVIADQNTVNTTVPVVTDQDTVNNTVPVITDENTLNTTQAPPVSSFTRFPEAVASGQLPLSIVNNFASSGSLTAYITGLDVNGRLVFVQSDGQFFYPTTNSSIPVPIVDSVAIRLGGQGSTTTVTLPGWISAARIWVSEGDLQFFVVESQSGTWSLVEPSVVAPNDPNVNVKFGFVELTNDANLGLFVNISFVDFVGLALGISVASAGQQGNTATADATSRQNVKGLSTTSASQICSALQAQAAIDGQPWADLCITDSTTGELLRILSPGDYLSVYPTAFSDYWTTYVDQVWQTYASQPLMIDTQTSAGTVSCFASGDQMACDGSSTPLSRPTAQDIFTCNTGPFAITASDNDVHRAIVPRLCAAFNRSTLLLSGGNVQPSLTQESYYTVAPTNFYSKFVHQAEDGGIGYAFSYDDVAPTGGVDQSGLVWSTNPSELIVNINGESI